VAPLRNWVTSNNFSLSWTGTDNASGLSHYDVYVASNPSGPWTELAQNTIQETISFTGDDDQSYYFRLIAYDRAGNSSQRWKTVQVRTFPYLSVYPNPLKWMQTLSNTRPHIVPLQVLNDGGKVMTWTAQTDFPYLALPMTTGVDDTTMPITLTNPLTYGTFTGVLTVTGTTDTRRSPATIPVTIELVDAFRYYLPIIFEP
jgi:fibronectin type 3 domain-containing protein